MNELENNKRLAEKHCIEVIQEKKQKQEFKLVNSIKPKKGHQVWRINKKTLEVTEPKYKKRNGTLSLPDALNPSLGSRSLEIIIEEGYEYISALNKKTALNRYKKGKRSALIGEGLMNIQIL